VNRARKAGTDAETKVKRYLIARGYRFAKLLRLTGAADEGDVHMGDGIPVCIEVKGGQGAIHALSAHVREMVAEVANAKAETGVTIIKTPRSANVADWYAVMPVSMYVDLIERLYPPPPRTAVRIRPNPRP